MAGDGGPGNIKNYKYVLYPNNKIIQTIIIITCICHYLFFIIKKGAMGTGAVCGRGGRQEGATVVV